MGYEDIVKVNFSYIESRFLCGFLVEKHDELIQKDQTDDIKELLSLVKKTHNKIMKKLEE